MISKKVHSWTGLPPKQNPKNMTGVKDLFIAILFSVLSGLVLGITPNIMASNLVGGKGLTGSTIPILNHSEVWPKKRVIESPTERLERLDLEVLAEKTQDINPTEIREETGSKVQEKAQSKIVKQDKKIEKRAQNKKPNPEKSKPPINNVPNKQLITLTPPLEREPLVKDGIVPTKVVESLLVRVRKDPSRIYVDRDFSFGDLTWSIRNASDEGIEFVVTNAAESKKTYYMPKAIIEGNEPIMEGGVLSPGQSEFGAIPFNHLRGKKEVLIKFQAIGFGEKKVKVQLPW